MRLALFPAHQNEHVFVLTPFSKGGQKNQEAPNNFKVEGGYVKR